MTPGRILAPLVDAWRRRTVRYAIAGFLLGLTLTIGGYVADYVSLYSTLPERMGFDTLRALHIVTPVHYFTDVFALILSLVGGTLGWLQDKVLYYSDRLETLVEGRTQALRASEERYALASRAANDGLWDWDLKTGEVYYSPSWFRGLGETPEPRTGSINDWIERLHPDDAQRFRVRISGYLQGRSRQFEVEYRIRYADGSYRWMRARGMKDGDTSAPHRFAGSQSDIDHRRTMEGELIKLALSDPLTGLPNRTAFLERLAHAFERARWRSDPASIGVVFLDIDQFKHINESMGHLQGDLLLKNVARRLEETLRRTVWVRRQVPANQDTETGDTSVPADDSPGGSLNWTLARTGGDEFAILLENLRTPQDAVHIVQAIQAAFREPFSSDSHDLFVTLSAGIQFGPEESECPGDLLRDADTAMYQAKSAGRGEYQVFTRTMRSGIEQQLRVESELQIALRNQEFRIVYQPVVDLRNGRLRGFEALIRWQHPERGLLPPGQFIHIAEETGAIVEIGRWAIRDSFRQFTRWQASHAKARRLSLSVNISRKQLCDPSLVVDISSACRETKIDPRHVHLEITESLVLDRPRDSCAVLEQLRDEGFKIAIDDFGTGHSSLYTIQTLPADILKIDRSFVCQLGKSKTASRIVATILALAKALGHKVIAEGVETEIQRAELERIGCRLSQGFLFFPPLTPARIEGEFFKSAKYPAGSFAPEVSLRS